MILSIYKLVNMPASTDTPNHVSAGGRCPHPTSTADLSCNLWPVVQPEGQEVTNSAIVTDAVLDAIDWPHSTNQTGLDAIGGSGTGLDFNITMTADVAAVTVHSVNDGANYKYHDIVSVTAKTGTVLAKDAIALVGTPAPTEADQALVETATFTGAVSGATVDCEVTIADVSGTFTITAVVMQGNITGANHTETFSATLLNEGGAAAVPVAFTTTADDYESDTFRVILQPNFFDPIAYVVKHDFPVLIPCHYVGSSSGSGASAMLVDPA
jgi:hypothetical protein